MNIIQFYKKIPVSLGLLDQIKDLRLFRIRFRLGATQFEEGLAVTNINDSKGIGFSKIAMSSGTVEFESIDCTLDEMFELVITAVRVTGISSPIIEMAMNDDSDSLGDNRLTVQKSIVTWLDDILQKEFADSE